MSTTGDKTDTRKTVQDGSEALAKAGTKGATVRKIMEASSRDMIRKNAEDAEQTLQKAAQDLRDTMGVSAGRSAERSMQTAGEAVNANREVSARTDKQLDRMSVIQDKALKEVTGRTQQNLDTMVRTGVKLADCFQSVMREWADYTRSIVQCNIDGMNNIMRARTPQDMMTAQRELLNAEVQVMLSSSAKIAEAMTRAAKEASESIGEQTSQRNQ